MKMNNRIFGIIGVGANKANWNADFEGNPRKYMGKYVASPFCLKYAYRNYWNEEDENVLFFKRYKELEAKKKENKGKIVVPLTLDDNLEKIIGKETDEKIIQKKLFDFIDVSCFGGAFASKKFNRSYTGTIQFGYGENKYDETECVRDALLSQFSTKEENKQTTIGSRTVLTEAHFFYDFKINPMVNKEFMAVDNSFEGFTKEAYEKFKEASLICVNRLNSVSKAGCYNEFAMFVTLKEGSKKDLGILTKNVKFYKDDEDNNIIDLSLVEKDLLEIKEDIENIELYYNPINTIVKISDLDNMTVNNILSAKKIDFKELI